MKRSIIGILGIFALVAAIASAQPLNPHGGSGTITTVTAGNGLTGGGVSGSVTLNVVPTTGGGLAISGHSIGLSTSCATNQILKWGGAGWVCAAVGGVIVDLTQAPYNITAGSTAAASANTAGIKQAITDYNGTHARLLLPIGIVYLGQDGTAAWSIHFTSGNTDLALVGHGPNSSWLAQYGAGTGGEWNTITVQGTRIELADFGVYQDTITTPDPIQENHLISIYEGATDVTGHDIYFGKSIGDQLRFFGNTTAVSRIHFYNFISHGHGTVTSTPPNGRVGSRSGIAIQRNYSHVQIDHCYIDGTQNTPFDQEPSGTFTAEYLDVSDCTFDNSQGNTSQAADFGGVSGGQRITHTRIRNSTMVAGGITVLATDDFQMDHITVISTAAYNADATTSSFVVRQINNDIVLKDVRIERTGTSGNGVAFDFENLGGSRSSIDGLNVYQTTTALPILIDASSDMRLSHVKSRYEGISPSSYDGIELFAVDGNSSNIQIDDVQVNSSGTMRSAIYLAARTPRTMSNVQIRGVHSAVVSRCVETSLGAGGTLDSTPIIQGIECKGATAWYSGDASDNPVTTLYPVVAGNLGAGAGVYEGTASTPESVLSAVQGSIYTYLGGASTIRFYKATGSSNTGWIAVQSPTGASDNGTTWAINTNKVTCTESSGNCAVAGTMNVVGALTENSNRVFSTVGTGLTSSGVTISALGSSTSTYLFDDFLGASGSTISSSWLSSNSGAGSGLASAVPEANRPGIPELVTGTTTTGRNSFVGGAGNYDTMYWSGGAASIEWSVRLPTKSDGTDTYIAWAGTLNTSAGAPTNGVFCRADIATSVNWQGCTVVGGAATCADTTPVVPITNNDWVHCNIAVNAAGTSVVFTVADVTSSTSGTVTSVANIPAANTRKSSLGVSIIKSAGTNSRTMDFDYVIYSQTFTAAR